MRPPERRPPPRSCRDCVHFENDPHWLEQQFPGLTILSSAFGDTRGDSGICQKTGRFLTPVRACKDYEPIHGDDETAGAQDIGTDRRLEPLR